MILITGIQGVAKSISNLNVTIRIEFFLLFLQKKQHKVLEK